MNTKFTEILVGLFVCTGIAALFFIALQVSNFQALQNRASYTITANFENISGLKDNALISMAGVPIGRVSQIQFNAEDYNAIVSMRIDQQYANLPTDTSASIYTAGLLGEKYIGLSAGGMEEFLIEGSVIELTQSSLVLEELISQFLFNSSDK
jgi:phospholipid/cholesterol/gamma-HCH transport system substrate-binding protein